MKRVCMVVQAPYPEDERVRRQAEALERAGVDVDVICMATRRGQPARESFGRVTAWRVLRQRNKETFAQYIALSLHFALASFFKLAALSMRRRYDAIQAHNMPDFLVFVGAGHRLMGRPVVLDLHDLSVELFGSKWGEGAKAKIFLPLVRLVEKLSCGFASRLITTSYGFRDRLIERGVDPNKITLVFNTPDSHIFQFQPDREFRRIERGARLLYHGTVQRRFGLETAIRAVALLQGRIPESTLTVHGGYEPSYRAELERLSESLGVKDRIALNEWAPLEEIPEIIRRSDIGLVPYLEDEFMNLALSTKTFEYATTGLPVAATRLKPVRTIFDETSIRFVEPGNAEDMAEKIAELCLDPDLRRKQTEAARRALENISGPDMERRYLDLMLGLMSRNRADATAA